MSAVSDTVGPGRRAGSVSDWKSVPDVHTVSKNASKSRPAKFLAFVMKVKGAPPVLPVN